jgi:Fur family transcriptional regulator, iron response regulator
MDATTASPWLQSASEQAAGEATDLSPQLIVGTRALRADCTDLLHEAGLRPTQQRLLLAELLFANGGRHVTADMLFTEAAAAGANISRATVYNTLNQFTGAGLLRQIGVDGSKSYFDTNPTAHHHFFVDQEDRLLDVPEPGVLIDTLPQPLPGYEVAGVDVIVHLRRKQI